MASAATLSLTAVTVASEFSNFIVFGDRYADAGQYVDSDTVFADEDNPIETDGRGRFTNRDSDGNIGRTWVTQVSRTLGYGDTNPSQPQTLDNSPPVATGLNFAGGFFDAGDIVNSINGVSALNGIRYSNGEEEAVVPGTVRLGLLADADTSALARNAIIVMNGGAADVWALADVERQLDSTIDLSDSAIERNATTRAAQAEGAAATLAGGAVDLRDAGAGLVVVSNLIDMGILPEAGTDSTLAAEGVVQLDAILVARQDADPTATFTDEEAALRADLQAAVDDPTLVQSIRSAATDEFNAALATALSGEDDIVLIDQNALAEAVLADPARFGLSAELDQTADCLSTNVLYPCNQVAGDASELVFADGRDFTTGFHELLADHAASVPNAPVLVSGLPFTAIASGREIGNIAASQVTPERIRRAGWAPFVAGALGQSDWNALSGEGSHGSMRLSGSAGVTYSFGNGIAVGAAASYQSIEDALSESPINYDGTAMYGTVFAGADVGTVFGSVSATVGSADYDRIARQTRIGQAVIENGGATEADVYGASLEVGVRALTYDILAAGPIASLDHWSAEVDGYTEDGWAATGVSYDSFDVSSTRASLGMFMEAGDLSNPAMPVVFRAKALYTREFETDDQTITARTLLQPDNTFSRRGRGAQADSMTIGAQLTYDFGPAIASIGYDGRIGENDDHAGRIDVSMPLGGR
jgi:phospholipase/lecithinase/hemolysin/uncharacterized protein YhjY with autotransporter beta-barrel domain